jgi:hypothetical protein
MIFTWTLTWCLYWIIMKHQASLVNVIGTVVSADIMVFLSFSSLRDPVSKGFRSVMPQLNKNMHLQHAYVGPKTNKTIQMNPVGFPSQIQIPRFIQAEKSIPSFAQVEKPRQATPFNVQKQVHEPSKLSDIYQQPTLKSNGCPKNLEYFTAKPRPKQTPEECFNCKNLITCVCRTD